RECARMGHHSRTSVAIDTRRHAGHGHIDDVVATILAVHDPRGHGCLHDRAPFVSRFSASSTTAFRLLRSCCTPHNRAAFTSSASSRTVVTHFPASLALAMTDPSWRGMYSLTSGMSRASQQPVGLERPHHSSGTIDLMSLEPGIEDAAPHAHRAADLDA